MIKFWIHTHPAENTILNGHGFALNKDAKSEKATIWWNKETVLAFIKKTFKNEEIIDRGNIIDIKWESKGTDGSTIKHHLNFVEVTANEES